MADVTAKLAEAARLLIQATKHLNPCPGTVDELEQALAAYEAAQAEPVAGLPKADIIRAAVAAMPHTNAAVADDLMAGHTMHTEADDVVAIFCAGLRLAAKEEAKPLKERTDFIAGYDAGLIDGRACERRDHAWGEIRADFEARIKADGMSVARLDCGLYFSPKVGNEWEAEKRKFAAYEQAQAATPAPAPQGWKLVPPEATPAMHDAYSRVLAAGSELDGAMVWAAMLAAAPVVAPSRAPLTDEQIDQIIDLPGCWTGNGLGACFKKVEFARAIERAHGIGQGKEASNG